MNGTTLHRVLNNGLREIHLSGGIFYGQRSTQLVYK